MQKRKLISILLSVVGPFLVHSQTVSALQQVIASNSLLSRPMVFRDLQAEMRKRMTNVKPGLGISDFYSDMADARIRLVHLVKAPEVDLKDNDTLVFYYIKDKPFAKISLTIANNKISIKDVLVKAQERIAVALRGVVNAVDFIPEEKKNAVIAGLYLILSNSGVAKDLASATTTEEYENNLAAILSERLIVELKKVIELYYPEVKLHEPYGDPERLRGYVKAGLDTAAHNLQSVIARALNKAEHTVADVINEASQILVRGNTGVAVTKGTGAFAGGIHVSLLVGSNLQFGVYGNGQFEKGDKTSSTNKSLLGIQARYAFERLQGDLLGSYMKSDIEDVSNEFGAGLAVRVTDDIVLGAALFGSFPKGEGFFWKSYGFTLRGTSANSPTLLIGGAKGDGSSTPVFQVSFPIVPSN